MHRTTHAQSRGDERLPIMHLRISEPMLAAIDEVGKRGGVSRSAAARELLVVALTRYGEWPPRPPAAAQVDAEAA